MGVQPVNQQTKPWYQSSTVWLNALGIVALALQSVLNMNFLNITPDEQATILAILNLLNRFRTSTKLSFR